MARSRGRDIGGPLSGRENRGKRPERAIRWRRAGRDGPLLAFVAALAVTTLGTLAFGADAPLPAYLCGASLCVAGLAGGTRVPLPAAFWIGAGLLCALTAREAALGSLWLAGPELAAMAGIAAAFHVGVQAGGRRASEAVALSSAALCALAALSFVLYAAGPDTVLGQPKPYHQGRLTGPFLSANTAATLWAMALVLGVGALRRAGRGARGLLAALEAAGRRAPLSLALTVLAGACLLLTGSRAGIAAGLAASAVVWLQGSRAPPRPGGLLVVLAVGLLVAAAASGVLAARVEEVGIGANGRLLLWRESLAAWREAPLLGHGLGSFPRVLARRVTVETAQALSVQAAAHNLALQWLVQAGVVGAGAGAACLLALARALRPQHARRDRWVVRAGRGALLAAVLHGALDYGLEVPAVSWWLALLTGLAAGAAAPSPGSSRVPPDARHGLAGGGGEGRHLAVAAPSHAFGPTLPHPAERGDL